MPAAQYSSDKSVKTLTEDRFSRWPFAKRISEIIINRSDPSCITIGLYGPWGDGKTSVLNFIQEAVSQSEDVIIVQFNPWLFGDQDSLILGYFNLLADALDAKLLKTSEKFKKELNKITPAVTAYLGWSGAEKTVGEFLNGPKLQELKERIVKALRENKKRVFVIVDDVDRLEKNEIQALFKLVKLTADFDYTAYILAFDKNVVAASLQDRYSSTSGKAGEEFLEKIIQIPLNLPAIPAEQLLQFCYDGINVALSDANVELSQNDVNEFTRDFSLAFEESLSTPRKARLYSNLLLFSIPLLKGEVNIKDLMLVEAVHVFAPNTYKFLLQNKNILTDGRFFSNQRDQEIEKDKIKIRIQECLDTDQINQEDGFVDMLQNLFPYLQQVYKNMNFGSGYQKEWIEAKRICTNEYFDRYFSFSIPENDISDAIIEEMILNQGKVQEALSSKNAGILIKKLRNKVSKISSTRSKTLSIEISRRSDILPNPTTFMQLDTPFGRAAYFVGELIMKVDMHERKSHASQCMLKSNSNPFALELLRALPRYDEARPEKSGFSTDEVYEIAEPFIENLEKRFSEFHDLTKEWGTGRQYLFFVLKHFGKIDLGAIPIKLADFIEQ